MRLSATTRLPATALGVALAAAPAASHAAISLGQVDTFENGTLQSWSAGGVSNPNGPANVATGGPDAADDNFLRLTANGGAAGGKLVVFNSDQWAGDYLTAGVESIGMKARNLGDTSLSLRLILNSGAGSAATLSTVDLPANSAWQSVSFPLTAANLSMNGGTALSAGTYAGVMSGVFELDLAHAPSFVSSRSGSPNVVAQLGVDDITAVGAVVPEPAGVGLGVLVMGIAAARRRRRGSVSRNH